MIFKTKKNSRKSGITRGFIEMNLFGLGTDYRTWEQYVSKDVIFLKF